MLKTTIYNKSQAKTLFIKIFNMMSDDVYNISVEKIKSTKTKKQLGYIFGGIINALNNYFNSLGCNFSPEQIKEWLYTEIGVTDTLYLPNGVQKEITKTLSCMNKQETSDFIFKLINFIDTNDSLTDFVLPVDLRYCWVNNVDESLINKIEQACYPVKDERYLNYQRSSHCIRCGKRAEQPHHIKQGSGLGRKNPDWFTVPICANCHTYLHSTVGEPNFLKEISNILGGLDIETFCQISYYLWKYHL